LNLSNAVQMQGVPCHSCSNFPIEGLKEATAITKPLDWDKILDEIQIDTKQKAIAVEAVLTSQRLASEWLMLGGGTKRFMIAEWKGILHSGKNIPLFSVPKHVSVFDHS